MVKENIKLKERVYKINNKKIEYGDNGIHTTKYTYITFVPKNLIEQFSKIANIYFVILIVLQTITAISITRGTPTILPPLLIIISISGIKDFYEDYKRRISDKEENFSQVQVFINNKWEICKCKDLNVGDLVKVENNEFIPADLLVLYSSEKGGKLYVETKNLDGETNLKFKITNKEIQKYVKKEDDLSTIYNSEFKYEKANPLLYEFSGSLLINDEKIGIDNDNFLLRGQKLRNSKYIIGSVSFNGHYTKVMMNSTNARPKKSLLEIQTNKYIILLFGILLFFCLIASFLYVFWLRNNISDAAYLNLTNISYTNEFFTRFGNWILIFGNFVPISLLVTIETVKFIQAIIISKDIKLLSKKNKTFCQVQNSSLNEELGQVEFIFSDKTGTLTCNEMIFKKLIINETPYGVRYNSKYTNENIKSVTNVDFKDPVFYDDINKKEVKDYLLFLSLCHTIVIEKNDDGKINYSADSPDELALTNFAKMNGCEFLDLNEENYLKINNFGNIEEYKLLYVLEFNSTRKRMSVIIKDKKGKIFLFCKGADNIILDRSNTENCYYNLDKLKEHLDQFAKEGLRTLLLAKKEIKLYDFEKWQEKYEKARNEIEGKKEKMEVLQEEIEQGLEIIGATAIEDKLQDKVEDCIDQFKKAGIKVWVLTGDKIETAKTIGFSCNLLNKDMHIFDIIDKKLSLIQDKIKSIKIDLNKLHNKTKKAIIVSGESLIEIMKNSSLSQDLNYIAQNCEAVLCCRVSPKQKQQIVRLVRDCLPDVRTLSIGDGANDVNMIIEAHIGIGIKGVEGQQAARSSDYAIGEFKHLRRLLFYYGRESYRKNSIMVLFNFYKNIVLVLPQFWYAVFMENYSGVTIYDSILYQLPNILFTSVPIIFYAILDKELQDNIIEKNYKLYIPGLKRVNYNAYIFLLWLCIGGMQAIIIVFVSYLINFNNSSNSTEFGFWGFGIYVFTFAMYISNLKIITITNSFYFLNIFSIVVSMILFYISFLVQSYRTSNELYGLFVQIIFNLTNILILILGLTLTSYLDYLYECSIKILFNRNVNKALDDEKNEIKKAITIKNIETYNQIKEKNEELKRRKNDSDNDNDNEKDIPVKEINVSNNSNRNDKFINQLYNY